MGATAQALHHGQIGFCIAHQLAQIDIFRSTRQPHPAIFPALRLNPAAFGQQVGDFHQVGLGNLVVLGNFRDGAKPVFVLAQIHQLTQSVVGKVGQAHDQGSCSSLATLVGLCWNW